MASLKRMAKDARSTTRPSSAKKESKTAALPSYKSTEFIEDSDAGDKKSEDDSDSDEEETPANTLSNVSKVNGKFVAPEGSSSESESESSEESDEDEDEDQDIVNSENSITIEKVSAKHPSKQPTGMSVSFKTAAYKPPTGFEQGKVDSSCRASSMFKASNLEGKQIWYFTAPASVPISSIKSMSLLDAKNGKPVLEYKGGDYAFLQDSADDKTYTRIMIPNGSDEGYKTASRSIDQVFHLQQVVKLAGVVDNAPTSNHSCRRVKKPARPQPKGLKMRFRPLGFGNGDLGNIGSSSGSESDEEMADAPVVPQTIPVASKSVSRTKSEKRSSDPSSLKRKHIEGEEKKSRTSSLSTTETPDHKKLKQSKKNKTESTIDTTNKQSASTNILESSTHNRQRETAIPVPKTPKAPQISHSQPSQSLQKSTKIDHRSTTEAAGQESVSKEERRRLKKLKKLKQEGSGDLL